MVDGSFSNEKQGVVILLIVCQQHFVDVLQKCKTPHVAKVKGYKSKCVFCNEQGNIKILKAVPSMSLKTLKGFILSISVQ